MNLEEKKYGAFALFLLGGETCNMSRQNLN